jgi:molybdenum cofactor synthesis domain-containing protein
MRPLTTLIDVETASRLMLEAVEPIRETEKLPVEKAVGRVAAMAVVSPLDVPPFDRAAMDGYAVVASATADAPVRLRCVEELYAGTVGTHRVEAGTCAEIATGAPLPDGADAVVMVENTRQIEKTAEGMMIEIIEGVKAGQHVTRRAADLSAGETVIEAGTLLTPARVGAIAAVGQRHIEVYRKPRITVGSTGNEIVEPGSPLAPGQIYNINAYSLCALFESLGCEVTMLPPIPDEIDALVAAIEKSLDHDMVVLSGGSSVGEKDLLVDAFSRLGDIVFHGIAIKPGKPTMLARVQGRPVVGMPGYPTSCLSNGYMFLAPAIDRMCHRPPNPRLRRHTTAAERMASVHDKHQLLTVRLTEDGRATRAFKESGVITSMSRADGFIEIPAGVDHVDAGEAVEVIML